MPKLIVSGHVWMPHLVVRFTVKQRCGNMCMDSYKTKTFRNDKRFWNIFKFKVWRNRGISGVRNNSWRKKIICWSSTRINETQTPTRTILKLNLLFALETQNMDLRQKTRQHPDSSRSSLEMLYRKLHGMKNLVDKETPRPGTGYKLSQLENTV